MVATYFTGNFGVILHVSVTVNEYHQVAISPILERMHGCKVQPHQNIGEGEQLCQYIAPSPVATIMHVAS